MQRSHLIPSICVLATLVAGAASGQQVESIFIAGHNADGYYVTNAGAGRLDVAILVDLRDERPAHLGARIEVKKRHHAEKEVSYSSTADLVAAGRKGSGGRDRWYLPSFSWRVSCTPDGRKVLFDGVVVGKSPLDFVIQAGLTTPHADGDKADEEGFALEGDSVAESDKKRLLCGKYTPLPPA